MMRGLETGRHDPELSVGPAYTHGPRKREAERDLTQRKGGHGGRAHGVWGPGAEDWGGVGEEAERKHGQPSDRGHARKAASQGTLGASRSCRRGTILPAGGGWGRPRREQLCPLLTPGPERTTWTSDLQNRKKIHRCSQPPSLGRVLQQPEELHRTRGPGSGGSPHPLLQHLLALCGPVQGWASTLGPALTIQGRQGHLVSPSANVCRATWRQDWGHSAVLGIYSPL